MKVSIPLASAHAVRDLLARIRNQAAFGKLPPFLTDADYQAVVDAHWLMVEAALFADDVALEHDLSEVE